MISPSDVLNIWDQEEAMGKKSISGSHDSSGSDFSFFHGPRHFRDFYGINIELPIKYRLHLKEILDL